MTKQEVIELIDGIYFESGEVRVGNLKLYSVEEMGDWGVCVEGVMVFCYYNQDDDEVTPPEQVYEWIAENFDWKF